MGNKSGKESEKLKELTSRFRIIQQDNSKNISLLQEKLTNRQCLLKETAYNDKELFNQALKQTQERRRALVGEQHVAALLQYFETSQDHYCSSFYKLYTLYDYPHKTLGDEISERQQHHRKFQEKELWSILASCILGLCHLQKAGIKHQCLSADSILLTEEGIIKVADPLATNEQTNYQALVTKHSTPHIYLSPQQCQALSEEKVQPQSTDPYKSDVFTLGMVMLEAGLLSHQDECYREENSKVHWDTVNYNLDKFGQIYSGELRSMLELMLEPHEAQRPVWTELEKYVKTGDQSDVGETRVHTPLNATMKPAVDQNPVQQSVPVPKVPSRPQSRNNTAKQDSVVGNASSMNATVPILRHLGGTGTVVNPFPNQSVNITYGPMNPATTYIPTATAKPDFQKTTSVFTGTQPSRPQPNAGIGRTQQPHQPTTTSSVKENISVTASQLQVAKPQFKGPLPASIYNTNTKIDENLVEVDEDDLTKTREPDEQSRNALNSARDIPVVPPVAFNSASPSSGTFAETSNFLGSAVPTANIPLPQTYLPPSLGYSVLQQTTSVPQYKAWQPTAGLTTGLPTAGIPSSGTTIPAYRTSIPLISQGPISIPSSYLSYVPTSSYPTSNLYSSPYMSGYVGPSVVARPQSNHYEYTSNIGGPAPIQHTSIGLSGLGTAGISSGISSLGTGIGSAALGSTLGGLSSYNLPPSAASYVATGSLASKPYEPYRAANAPPPSNQLSTAKYTQSIDITTNRAVSSERDNAPPAPQPVPNVQYVTEEFKQGSKYEGEKVNGMRHGKGKFYYQDGGLYDGEWRENQMSGHGKLFYQSGRIAYDGEWKDDQFTGHGVLYNEYPVPLERTFDYTNLDLIDEYWTKFEGEFEDDLKQGKGKLYLSNGEYFEGEFDKDTAIGQGEFHTASSEVIKGIWNNNQLEKRLN